MFQITGEAGNYSTNMSTLFICSEYSSVREGRETLKRTQHVPCSTYRFHSFSKVQAWVKMRMTQHIDFAHMFNILFCRDISFLEKVATQSHNLFTS